MGQQFKPRRLELPFPSHFLELIWDNTEVFQGKPKDVISPASPESDLRPPPGMTCPEHLTHNEMFWAFLLTGGILVRCLNHGNWFLWTWKSSISTLDPCQITELFTRSKKDARFEKVYFWHLYPWFYSFSYYPSLVATGDGSDIDIPVWHSHHCSHVQFICQFPAPLSPGSRTRPEDS